MSLLVVAALALVFGGVVAWLVRLAGQDQRLARAELVDALRRTADAASDALRAERRALDAHLEREALAAREERRQWADRIQNPLGAAAAQWPVPEAQRRDTLLEAVDEEWLEREESLVPYDPDLVLADAEEG